MSSWYRPHPRKNRMRPQIRRRLERLAERFCPPDSRSGTLEECCRRLWQQDPARFRSFVKRDCPSFARVPDSVRTGRRNAGRIVAHVLNVPSKRVTRPDRSDPFRQFPVCPHYVRQAADATIRSAEYARCPYALVRGGAARARLTPTCIHVDAAAPSPRIRRSWVFAPG